MPFRHSGIAVQPQQGLDAHLPEITEHADKGVLGCQEQRDHLVDLSGTVRTLTPNLQKERV